MPITTLPTRTEGAGTHELGQTKLEDGSYTDATKQIKAAFWNRLLDYLIALATEVGLTNGTTPGSLRADKADKTTTLTAGIGLTGGGDLSANRTFTVDIAGTNPLPLGTASPGASGKVSDRDHVHAHGSLTDETLHARVTPTAHGFLDKDVFDSSIGTHTRWQTILKEYFKGGTINPRLTSVVSGTGAAVSTGINAGAYLGMGSLTTGTTATGTARYQGSQAFWQDNAGDFFVQEAVATLENVPDGTEDYRARFVGLGGPTGTENGFSITVDRAVSTTHFLLTTWNAGTPTHTVSTVALDTARHRYRSVYDRAADTVTFFIDGVNVGTLSTAGFTIAGEVNLPFYILKVAGTTARRILLEYCSAEIKYTVGR